jgi:sRNA-binding regulator protein Hfq
LVGGSFMAFFKRRHFNNNQHGHINRRRPDHADHSRRHQDINDLVHPEHTGSEAAYLKSLVDTHAKVTVVLTNGERFQGFIRYYDQYCFSVGLSADGPRIFIRKDSVSYIAEDFI